ncbi:hypothetical protein [Thiolapillus sp.]|uniref:hypothetical protein n=3 Tax=Thiolapillus sp. TaxID=2017437 RepID=UPI0026000CD9|nr:hypothetical protein [Thiolapillus sp.]
MRHWLLLLPLTLAAGNLCAWELAGNMAVEGRVFFQSPLDPRQYDNDCSVSLEPEFSHQWDDNRQSFVFRPFGRLDRHDDERSHWGIRELQWIYAGDGWETRLGVGKVYWGVTEAMHLVDIINQTDLVENIDGEQKLGQPMAKLSLEKDWGTLDFFLLPGFRERTFPGEDGRLRTHPRVDPDLVTYESSAEQRHVDYALRWSHYIGEWDMGVSWFQGTGRDPLFRQAFTPQGELVLAPYYEQIEQASVDLQATLGEWLWKLEALYRNGQDDAFYALTGGFEYTKVGIMETQADLGVVAELMLDDRGDEAATPFNHDLFLGLRWTANDAQSLAILGGTIVDWENGSTLLNIEASRRFGQAYLLTVQLRSWLNVDEKDLQYPFRQDDYMQVELARYF